MVPAKTSSCNAEELSICVEHSANPPTMYTLEEIIGVVRLISLDSLRHG